ncbi:uncharacterized protein LOC114578948 [Dendrobium catenatum]|uniref:uncharacterized protein LOC114578948 n=1 Tax=Dendrobium catenatum TaxID=906689 RepID=UPI00109F2F29|nr:uncharacterized protein LOC114578948 [Dendrobium catenatum]
MVEQIAATKVLIYDHKKGLKGYFIVIIVLSSVVLLIGGFSLLWKYRSRMEVCNRRRMRRPGSLVDQSGSVGGQSTGFSSVIDLQEQGKGEHNVRLFGFQTIEEATINFSSSNLLGEGGLALFTRAYCLMGKRLL